MHGLKLISGLVLACFTGSAAVQASGFAGPYVGAKAGANISTATSLNSKAAGTAGVEAGYNWDLQDGLLFGLSGYGDFNGKATHAGTAPATVHYGSQVYGLSLKLGIPSGPWMPYAKLGYARVDGIGDNYAAKVKANALGYGAGIEYKLMPDLGLAAEWDGNNAKHAGTTLHNNNFTLGLNYYFGTSEPAPAPMPVAAQAPSQPAPAPGPRYKTILSSKPVTLGGANFATASAKLRPTAFTELDEVVQFARQYPDAHLMITGYTDSRGSSHMNHALSEHRAESVKTYLVGKGVAAGRITTQGMGEEHPIADNATAAGRAKNRRVEIRSVIQQERQVPLHP